MLDKSKNYVLTALQTVRLAFPNDVSKPQVQLYDDMAYDVPADVPYVIAERAVELGFAEVAEVESEVEAEADEPVFDVATATKAELVEFIKANGITGTNSTDKVDVLREAVTDFIDAQV